MATERKNVANRRNARKSTGPRTPAGKRYSSQNAVKHGFFSRNPSLSEIEQEEFDTLVSQLEKKYLPKTPLQHLAVRDIAWCTWRRSLALMLEARSTETLMEQTEKTETDISETAFKPTGFYASSPLDLRAGISFMKGVLEDFRHIRRIRDEWKPDFDLLFGPTFFQSLSEWNALVSTDDVMLAHMMRTKAKNWDMHLPGDLEESMKAPTVVVDPLQNENLKEKLLEFQLRHMQELLATWQQRAEANTAGNPRIVDFSPRYYTTATRDLHRAVEWFWRLKELEGAA